VISKLRDSWLLEATEASLKAGLRFGDKGTHTSRTSMFSEISDVLDALPASASRKDYARAIIYEDVLGKNTASTRRLTDQRLSELYALDLRVPIFRVLRYIWDIDEAGRPLLSLLCALARDPLLRATAPTILGLSLGEELVRSTFLDAMRDVAGRRLNESILDKVARNAGSSWTQSGHLEGRVRKTRKPVRATPGSAAFAVWLGWLQGHAGASLLTTPWASVFDQNTTELMNAVLRAKQMRLLSARMGGGVIEIDPTELEKQAEVNLHE